MIYSLDSLLNYSKIHKEDKIGTLDPYFEDPDFSLDSSKWTPKFIRTKSFIDYIESEKEYELHGIEEQGSFLVKPSDFKLKLIKKD